MLIDFFSNGKYFFHDFRLSFPRESSFARRNRQISNNEIWSKLETKEQSNKMLIYWAVPDRLVTPGTESLTHTDLLDAVTHTHLRLANLAKHKPVSTFSFSHFQNFHLFFTDRSISECFHAFCKYDTKGWDLRPGGGQPFGSSLSKWLSSICKFAGQCC